MSSTLNQVPRVKRERIPARLAQHAAERDLYRVELSTYHKDTVGQERLAYGESHGRWIEWIRHD